MFGFIKKVFIAAVTFLIPSVLSVNSLKCISMNNQECKARPKIIDTNANEPVFYPYSINTAGRRRPGTSPEGHLKVLTSGTSRGPSEDAQVTNRKIDNLMKKWFFRCNSPCFTHLFLFFTGKTNMQKV